MPKKSAPKKAAKRSRAPIVRAVPRLGGPTGPIAGLAANAPHKNYRETHPLLSSSGTREIVNAMGQALLGRMEKFQDLCDDMRDRDDRVDAVCRTRVLAPMGRPWSVKPPPGFENDAEAKQVAENVRLVISQIRTGEGGGWASCVAQLCDGILRGYSVNEIEWSVSKQGWHVPRALHWRHPRRFLIDEQLRLCKFDSGDPRDGIQLSAYGPDKFVVHTPSAGRSSYITRRGVMLAMILPSLAKRTDVKLWLKGTERWGMPLPIIELPEGTGDNDEIVTRAKAMLNALTANWNAVLWGGAKLAKFDGSGSVNPAIYRELADFCNTAIAVIGLGQNLTTEVQGGSYAAATAHNFVRADLFKADVGELDDTLLAQLVEPIVRYNWPGAPVPVYETSRRDQGEIKPEHLAARIVTIDEARAALGLPPLPDGKGSELVGSATATQAPPGGAAAADPFAMERLARALSRSSEPPKSTSSTSPTRERSPTKAEQELYRSLVA